jgi:hypothetical protein
MERATIYGSEMDAAILRGGNYTIEKQLHQRLIETGEPFVLVCEGNEASIADAALFCGAQEIAASGLRIKFLFRTNRARLTSDSDAIRMYLRELVASFSAAVSSSPRIPQGDRMIAPDPTRTSERKASGRYGLLPTS